MTVSQRFHWGPKVGSSTRTDCRFFVGVLVEVKTRRCLVRVLDGVTVTVAEYRWAGFVEWEHVAE